MLRDSVNALARSRRDVRMALVARYRALVGQHTRFVLLARLAATVVDVAGSLRRVRSGLGTLPTRIVDRAVARVRARRPGTLTVVRAVVGGTAHVSVCVAGPASLLAQVDGLRLTRPGTVVDLNTITSVGTTVRLHAVLPDDVLTGDVWTLTARAGSRTSPLLVADRRVVDVGARLTVTSERMLGVSGTLPVTAPVVHRLLVGVRSAVVRWPADGPTGLVLVPAASGVAPVEVAARTADGTARATVDLAVLAGAPATTWTVHAQDAGTRRPLQLPLTDHPRLDRPAQPRVVALPGPDGAVVPVEVGYTAENLLVVRVGHDAVAAGAA